MKNTMPGNFACKDKDVRRERRQITMNINADNNGRGHGHLCFLADPIRAATPHKKRPGAVSRPGTPTQFQFHE
jgi:hypothetical protein